MGNVRQDLTIEAEIEIGYQKPPRQRFSSTSRIRTKAKQCNTNCFDPKGLIELKPVFHARQIKKINLVLMRLFSLTPDTRVESCWKYIKTGYYFLSTFFTLPVRLESFHHMFHFCIVQNNRLANAHSAVLDFCNILHVACKTICIFNIRTAYNNAMVTQ